MATVTSTPISTAWRSRAGVAQESLARTPWQVIGLAAVFAAGASLWSAHSGSMTLYNDAKSHLDIARRVTDALTPGLAQLGTVWLPLQQLLLVPFVAIEPLWHSGAAGAIVSGIAFVYAAVRVYGLATEWFGSRLVAWTAFTIFVTNPNVLYMQSTALQEPLLLAFLLGTAYHLSRWTRTFAFPDLIASAVLTFCATLTRYDGWALFAGALALLLVWGLRHDRRSGSTEANVLVFAIVGGYGIGLWLLYNLIIFHNPWAWYNGQYSAQAQQAVSEHLGQLPTAHNLGLSVLNYGWDILDVCSVGVALLAAVGIVTMLARGRGRGRDRSLFLVALLCAPVFFNVASLYLGQSVVEVPQVAPFNLFNDRYGIMALPLLVMCAAALVAWRQWLAPMVIAVALAGAALAVWQTPITLADGISGVSEANSQASSQVAGYLGSHYRGGRVLADDSRVDPLEFSSGLPLRDFVVVGFQPYYGEAVVDPAAHVEWVIAAARDAIAQDIHDHPRRFLRYRLVMRRGPILVFRRTAAQA